MVLIAAIFVMILLYLFFIMPRLGGRKRGADFEGISFAHRGLFSPREHIPENSLPAFRRAVQKGYGIELDVQRTKDDQIVVFHDSTLSRMCSIDIPVWEKTYDQLKELKLQGTEEGIPLLSQVLSEVKGQVPLLIEIKQTCLSCRTCELLDTVLKDYPGLYCVESFNALALFWYRRHRPHIYRGQLSANLLRPVAEGGIFLSFCIQYLLGNIFSRPDFIAYCYRDQSNLSLRILHKLFRVPVFVWTIQSQKEFQFYSSRFDNIIFDSFIPKKS